MAGEPMPKPPYGYEACRVHDGDQKLLALGAARQVTHLVAVDRRGHNGGRPTMCGLTRFDDISPDGRYIPGTAALPGWSMGGGVSGGNIVQLKCGTCWDAAERMGDFDEQQTDQAGTEDPSPRESEAPSRPVSGESSPAASGTDRQDPLEAARVAASEDVKRLLAGESTPLRGWLTVAEQARLDGMGLDVDMLRLAYPASAAPADGLITYWPEPASPEVSPALSAYIEEARRVIAAGLPLTPAVSAELAVAVMACHVASNPGYFTDQDFPRCAQCEGQGDFGIVVRWPCEPYRLAEALRQAVAHDRQPHPTAWAYEQVCSALRRREAEVEALRAVPDDLDRRGFGNNMKAVRQAMAAIPHSGSSDE